MVCGCCCCCCCCCCCQGELVAADQSAALAAPTARMPKGRDATEFSCPDKRERLLLRRRTVPPEPCALTSCVSAHAGSTMSRNPTSDDP